MHDGDPPRVIVWKTAAVPVVTLSKHIDKWSPSGAELVSTLI